MILEQMQLYTLHLNVHRGKQFIFKISFAIVFNIFTSPLPPLLRTLPSISLKFRTT
jgi:hypothetical protein